MVGSSMTLKTLLRQTCPAASKDKMTIGIRSMKFRWAMSTSPVRWEPDENWPITNGRFETTPEETSAAAMKMRVVWMRNERAKAPRWRKVVGWEMSVGKRWMKLKKRAPIQNEPIATNDLMNWWGWAVWGRPPRPSAAKIVFPVCMPTKQFQLLKATASIIPLVKKQLWGLSWDIDIEDNGLHDDDCTHPWDVKFFVCMSWESSWRYLMFHCFEILLCGWWCWTSRGKFPSRTVTSRAGWSIVQCWCSWIEFLEINSRIWSFNLWFGGCFESDSHVGCIKSGQHVSVNYWGRWGGHVGNDVTVCVNQSTLNKLGES